MDEIVVRNRATVTALRLGLRTAGNCQPDSKRECRELTGLARSFIRSQYHLGGLPQGCQVVQPKSVATHA